MLRNLEDFGIRTYETDKKDIEEVLNQIEDEDLKEITPLKNYGRGFGYARGFGRRMGYGFKRSLGYKRGWGRGMGYGRRFGKRWED